MGQAFYLRRVDLPPGWGVEFIFLKAKLLLNAFGMGLQKILY